MTPIDNAEIHALAKNFSERSGFPGIIFITKRPELISEHYGPGVELYITCNIIQMFTYRLRKFPAKYGVMLVPYYRLKKRFLEDKTVVCIDYLEDRVFASYNLRRILRTANFSVSTVTSVNGWSLEKLRKLVIKNKTALVGLSNSRQHKQRYIAISGVSTDIYRKNTPDIGVLAVIAQYNENDIIFSTVKHLLNQGVDVHILDNWSDDGSYEKLLKLAAKNKNRLYVERFPLKNNKKFELAKTLERVTEISNKRASRYKWTLNYDADEIRWSPWPGISLQKAISFIDAMGYNCIDFTVFNFSPTKDGFKAKDKPLEFFKYGEFGSENWYFIQLKGWKNNPSAEMASTGGHVVTFPGRRIYPLKFLNGHYPLRSTSQAQRKIFKDRMPRFPKSEKKRGWHVQYDSFEKQHKVIRDSSGLINFSSKDFWSRYLMQRLAGIGIERSE